MDGYCRCHARKIVDYKPGRKLENSKIKRNCASEQRYAMKPLVCCAPVVSSLLLLQ